MITTERFNGIRAFVQAVEAGSFSAAARQLGLSSSSVGKAVARLEQRLDARLFHRTTRSLSLTDEGLAFHDSCLRALGELDRAESALTQRRAVPSGRLRIALPVLYGRDRVMPVLLRLAASYPALSIDAVFSNRPVDFAEDAVDLAVRIGDLDDSATLAARRLGTQHQWVCAAPAYLARCGTPVAPEDLARHDCIGMLRDDRAEPWRFTPKAAGKAGHHVKIAARLRLSALEAVTAAAKAGMGLAQLPAWLVEDAVAAGELTRVLIEYEPDGLPVHAVWPATRQMTARLRAVIDALRDASGSDAPLRNR